MSGHLVDEREALELFGDVLRFAGNPEVALTACVMAGAAGKAAKLAGELTAPVVVEPWARSPARFRQAAAAQVIGAQAPLYGTNSAAKPVHLLLGLTAGLWTSPRIAPHPALDAVNALSRFGKDLPVSAVDPVLTLMEPHLSSGGTLTPETAELLIQLYWAVPSRRDDVAGVIGPQLALAVPPLGLWQLIGNLPLEARGPVMSTVAALADSGNSDALRTLASWREPTTAVQLAARRTCARLLREPAGQPAALWSATTRASDAVMLLDALASTNSPAEVDPNELRPGVGPILPEKVLFSMSMSAGPPTSSGTGSVPSSSSHDQPETVEATPSDQTPSPAESGSSGQSVADVDSDTATGDRLDAQAVIAAGPPADLAAAVAEHFITTAESHNPPAFVRADAVAALHSLLEQLTPDVSSSVARRVLAIAESPGFNAYDQLELNSQHALSQGRIDLGAKRLPTLALVTAATAAALAARAGSHVEILPGEAVRLLITKAVDLLHAQDHVASKDGATALALASRFAPSAAAYAGALLMHPDVEVRAVAASTAALDEAAQRILATDPSPQVRTMLASRSGEITEDILAALRADKHPSVQRALAAGVVSDG